MVFGRDQSVKKILESDIPFVATYHPQVKELGKLIRDLLPFLDSDGEVQKVFSPPPVVSYKSTRKIKDYIMRSKLYPVARKIGCGVCGSSGCQVCQSMHITDEFTSFTIKKRIKSTLVLTAMINVSFTCWAVSHAVNNMKVTQPTISEVDEISIRVMLEKLRVVT